MTSAGLVVRQLGSGHIRLGQIEKPQSPAAGVAAAASPASPHATRAQAESESFGQRLQLLLQDTGAPNHSDETDGAVVLPKASARIPDAETASGTEGPVQGSPLPEAGTIVPAKKDLVSKLLQRPLPAARPLAAASQEGVAPLKEDLTIQHRKVDHPAEG